MRLRASAGRLAAVGLAAAVLAAPQAPGMSGTPGMVLVMSISGESIHPFGVY